MAKRKWTDEQLIDAVKTSRSVTEVLRKLDVKSRPTVMKRIQELHLDTSRLQKISSGLNLDFKPNAYWRRFKERLDKYDEIPVENWKEEQILGHILKRYKDHMGVEFNLSYSGPPTKCKEIYCVRKVLLYMGTDDGASLKAYVDWVFDTNIIPNKVAIKSIAYFFTTNLILKFKAELRKRNKITRATELPENYIEKIHSLELDVKTYGDLAFAKAAIDNDPEDDDLVIYFKLFEELRGVGFDEKVLQSLG